MAYPIITVELRYEHDVVLARQRARQISHLLGFDHQDQIRLATAVSELARNAYMYAARGKVDFAFDLATEAFQVRVTDQGPGIRNLSEILDGRYTSPSGMGLGIIGAKRLMDNFSIDSAPGRGTAIFLEKHPPPHALPWTAERLHGICTSLAQLGSNNPLQEFQRQNQELLRTMTELERRQLELAQLNRELEDTNRGVVALYAELDEKADYLRRAAEIKSRFLSNMTHEFRTPLNSILSLSRILLDKVDGPLGSEQEKQLNFIRRAAADLSELVNDLLDLAKVEAGKIVIRPGHFEVSELFGALRGMLRPLLAHNSSINLVFDEPKGIPTLFTDESKLSQILRNFISNALKYTEGGEVRVSAQLETDGVLAVSVADTGIGIVSSDQERIFEEFTQVEGPHQKVKGTGLGLPLSKKLAELLGGFVQLKSEVGVGSTFTVRLPIVYRGPSEVAYVAQMTRELDPTRLPILVVDDNTETLFIYEKYLKGTGFQLIPARTVREARQRLSEFRPIAIVMDILLANESSWDFIEELKSNESTREIPMYVVTMVENKQKALSLGANDYHVKPIDRAWLLGKLRTAAGPRRGEEILIIDDDEASRYVLSGLLADTRYRVVEASGGHEGVRMAQEGLPSAIFLDLNMPDLNGLGVLQKLRAIEETRAIPVIIHTAKNLDEQQRRQLEPFVVAVISKDHSVREASVTRVREALSAARTRRPGVIKNA